MYRIKEAIMSIKILYKSTALSQRRKFVDDLTFESKDNYNKKSKYIYGFDTDETKEGYIYIPYQYGIQNGFKNDFTYPHADIQFTGVLRPVQEEVKPKILELLTSNGCCTISLPCGAGKTICSIYIASVLKVKTLIMLFNKLMLAEQWQNAIEKVTNSKVQFLKSKSIIDLNNDFFIVNAINVPKLGRVFNDVGLLISDEIQLAATPVGAKALNYITPKYSIGLSATPFRLDGLNNFLFSYFGESVVKTYKRKHTVFIIKTGIKLKYTHGYDGKIDWNSVLNAQALNEERNKVIVKLICKNPQRNFLVLSRRVEQAEWISEKLKNKGVDVDILTGTKRKYDEKARVLVATSAKASVGFDHPFMDTLLMAGDAEAYFEQFLGRVLARSPTIPHVYDFVDASPSVLMKHLKSRCEVYKRFGADIIQS